MKRRLGGLAVLLFIWPFLLRAQLRTQAGAHAPQHLRESRPHWLVLAERYGLVPKLSPGPVTFDGGADADRRWLHSAGDPDSMFTVGGRSNGRTRVAAAIEINDVIPRALSPQPDSVTAGRPRSGGDYQPIDVLGNPRQLRVGARVRW